MNLPLLMACLTAGGCRMQVYEESLRVVGPKELLTPQLQSLLASCKPELVAWLNQQSAGAAGSCDVGPGELPAAWVDEWEERAGVVEYDGGLARVAAEAAALQEVLRQVALDVSMGRCVQGKADGEPGEGAPHEMDFTTPLEDQLKPENHRTKPAQAIKWHHTSMPVANGKDAEPWEQF